jgi:hypothetical protein
MVGYTINLRYMTVELTADQQVTVCRYLSDSGFVGDHRMMDNGNWTNQNKSWYCFADMDDLKWGVENNDMFCVFLAFGFEPSTPRISDKTITDVSYHGDAGDAMWLWHHIAKALPELDGFIEWDGERGDRFRWVFKGGVVDEIAPSLVWENDA